MVQISYNEDTTIYFPRHGHPSSRTSFPHWGGKLASWLVIVQNSHWATFYQQTWSTVHKRAKLSALLPPCTWVVKVRPLLRDVVSLFFFPCGIHWWVAVSLPLPSLTLSILDFKRLFCFFFLMHYIKFTTVWMEIKTFCSFYMLQYFFK